MMDFTHDEKMLLMIYGQSTKEKTVEELKMMKAQLTAEETELKEMTEYLMEKLRQISETEYSKLCLYP